MRINDKVNQDYTTSRFKWNGINIKTNKQIQQNKKYIMDQ